VEVTAHASLVPKGLRLTFAGSGIGRACALALAKAGARAVVVSDLDLAAAEKVAEEIPSVASNPEIRVAAIKLDVTVEDDVRAAITLVKEKYGRIDYCVHSAGVSLCIIIPPNSLLGIPLHLRTWSLYALHHTNAARHIQISASTFNPASAVNVSDFKNVININLTGTLLVTSAAAAAMKSQEPLPYNTLLPGRGSTRGAIVNLSSLGSVVTLPNMVAYNTSKHGVAAITKTAGMLDHAIT
jgi:NAD(P)-dependent dehydrogenase (short-subunit alcohol dehydrogenase family)